MDSHVFRRIVTAITPLIMGARLEKIHAPLKNITQFTFFGQGKRHVLLVKSDRREPFIFIHDLKIPASSAPPNYVMRLRKYIEGHRVIACINDWSARKLWLKFNHESQIWLCLDICNEPSLHFDPPEHIDEPYFPKLENLADIENDWQHFPVLTPLLRQTLLALDDVDKSALLIDLESGEGDIFVYGDDKPELCAWYLPPNLRKNRIEEVYEDVLEAALLVGKTNVISASSSFSIKELSKAHVNESKRLSRLLLKLEQEEIRLKEMYALKDDALILQANLYNLDAQKKLSSISLNDLEGNTKEIKLDKKLSLQENMQSMFNKSRRGKRGLDMLGDRREQVRLELKKSQEKQELAWLDDGKNPTKVEKKNPEKNKLEKNNLDKPSLPKNIQAFKSSDGFILLRGRDAKGNLQALKMAKSYDLWLHAQGTVGAHIIIRLSHIGQEVPQRTLEEAANLAALKSPFKDAQTALIECAFAKYVHPIKSRLGLVRIDRHEPSINIQIDSSLEERLALG